MAHMLATYIALPGTTAEAMEHWQEVFGGDLEIIRYGDAQLKDLPFDPPSGRGRPRLAHTACWDHYRRRCHGHGH